MNSAVIVAVVLILVLLSSAAFFQGVPVQAQLGPNIVASTVHGSLDLINPGHESSWSQLQVLKLGETARLNAIGMGDQLHSFHVHKMRVVPEWYFPGKNWPAVVFQLVPGAADSVFVTPQQSGVWLYHCHVVFRTDVGMIGAILVTE